MTVPYESPQPVVLAERTMKARHPGTCALDGCPVFTGDRIGLIPGTGWARVACIIARNRNTSTEETT